MANKNNHFIKYLTTNVINAYIKCALQNADSIKEI